MASTRPTPSFPTTLGSEGRTGYTPWMRYKSFMLIGACSTPISTWPAVACWRFGKAGKFEDDSWLAESSDLPCTHSAPPVLVMAEFDEVATGERTPARPQAAARARAPGIDRRGA